ncbi:CLK4-associating serine/arginine rich protein-like [Panicum virgatum]|uniref:Uncharacterized protein n=1 Tax=Panicum virgatum TaxID=38727 RepID=A0A8T0WE61_PANVG|nr:CLK4-associating serine/arginine rich protein-like [Panicum virgatum]KAG2647861.1 hypothetical protein PVAP13_1NG005800 [Panicum virgatum]
MGNGVGDGDAASGRRCPKHPSQPSFTGFCSACLLDRLHATNLIGVASPSQPPPSLPLHQDDLEEPPPPCSTEAAGRRTGRAERTTLLRLFQLEDQGEERAEDTNAAPSTSGGDGQDPPPHLQRKRSLRHSCSEWIACCDANHSSCIPSRQSLDASSTTSAAAAAAAAPAAGVAPAANPYPNDAAATSVAMVERRTGSLRWNQLWAIKGLLANPAGHLLSRSFSESSRSRYALQPGSGTIARSSSSQSQGIRLNGSRSVSSAGNGMDSSEISLPGDSVGHAHVHRCRPRLKDRLRWLRRSRSRSRSVHYSSPTRVVDAGLTPFRSRSSSSTTTRSTSHKNQSRFASGFFAAQRNRQ